MSTLTSLKLTNATKPTSMPVIQQKRNKLTTKIWEQIQLAEAQASGVFKIPVNYIVCISRVEK